MITLKQLKDFANNFGSEIFDYHDCKPMKKENIEEFFNASEQYTLGFTAGTKFLVGKEND